MRTQAAVGVPSDPAQAELAARRDLTRGSGMTGEGVAVGTIELRAKSRVELFGLAPWAEGAWYIRRAKHVYRNTATEAGGPSGTYTTSFVADAMSRLFGKYSGEVASDADETGTGACRCAVPAVFGAVEVVGAPLPALRALLRAAGRRRRCGWSSRPATPPIRSGWARGTPTARSPEAARVTPPTRRVIQTAVRALGARSTTPRARSGSLIRHKQRRVRRHRRPTGSVLAANPKGRRTCILDATAGEATLTSEQGHMVTHQGRRDHGRDAVRRHAELTRPAR